MAFEIRFRLPKADLFDEILNNSRLKDMSGAWNLLNEKVEETYYDTEDKRLLKENLTYCLRCEDEKCLAVVKVLESASKEFDDCKEWAVFLDKSAADINVFEHSSAGSIIKGLIGSSNMKQLFKSKFERQSIGLSLQDGSNIVLMYDRGEFINNNVIEPISELNLKLQNGQKTALLRTAKVLAEEYPLMLQFESRNFHRLKSFGIMTADKEMKSIYELNNKENAPEALRNILLDLLHRVVKYQQEFTEDPGEPETIHQLRVILRKLRSILFFSRSFIDKDIYKSKQDSMRKLGLQLSELRELDVLAEECDKIIIDKNNGLPDLNRLKNIIVSRRTEARAELLGKILEGSFTNVLLDFWLWLLEYPFKVENGDEAIDEYTDMSLDLLSNKLVDKFKKADFSDSSQIHQIRIESKKLRYIIEIFKPIIKSDKVKLQKTMKELQDTIGSLHDTYINTALINELTKDKSDPELNLQASIFIGFQISQAAFLREKLKKFHL